MTTSPIHPPFTVKTHRPPRQYQGHHFFVLSRGYNAGRPMRQPCPNCLVIVTGSEAEKEQLYWLCNALWQTKSFRPVLVGSVIMLIRIRDFKRVVMPAYHRVQQDPVGLSKTIKHITVMDEYQQNLLQLTRLTQLAKDMILKKMIIGTTALKTDTTNLQPQGI